MSDCLTGWMRNVSGSCKTQLRENLRSPDLEIYLGPKYGSTIASCANKVLKGNTSKLFVQPRGGGASAVRPKCYIFCPCFLSRILIPHPSLRYVEASRVFRRCTQAAFGRLEYIQYSLSDIGRRYSHCSGRTRGHLGRSFNGSYHSLLPATRAPICVRVHDILYVRAPCSVLRHS